MADHNPIKELIDQIWAKYDDDNSGVINGEEVDRFLDDICQGEDLVDKREEILNFFDVDGDGEISKAEVYNFFIGE